eukprot:TRINITY_DN9102_c0_g1_i2.p1 TRINITY_DN9102_c0_g1~~TRINITY_DN9102_c0_g1_i2.p1  ORF type:complete len:484 (-),score=98.28 TRINITY_DN9102_c0_g1_i2:323-1774(-)
MFDKKNKRSEARDDSPEYGFDRRSDLAKLYWEGPRSGNQKVTTSATEFNTVSCNNVREKNGDQVYDNSNPNPKYKSSNLLARNENSKSVVPFNFRPVSSLGMGNFQSPVSPSSKYEKQHRGSVSEFENSSFGSNSKQEPYSSRHTTSGNDISIYENSSMPYKPNTSYISSGKENVESYKRIPKEQYNSYRPASSLGMGSFQSPVTPTTEYAKQRRGSVSDFEDNSFGMKLKSERAYNRRKSADVSPDGFEKYQQRNKGEKVGKYDINKNRNSLLQNEPSSISGNIWSRTYKTASNLQYEPPVSSSSLRRPISRSDEFDSATRFDDTISSTCTVPPLPMCPDYNQSRQPTRPGSRLRHKTLAYGVAKEDLDSAKSTHAYSHGSNEDLERVLRELDNTGYFSETIPSSSRKESQNSLTSNHRNKNCQNGGVDYKKLWEESQTENTRLRLQLGEVKNELESVRSQLEAMAIQVIQVSQPLIPLINL